MYNKIIGMLGLQKIKRKCSICGAEFEAELQADKTYKNGHYFGLLNEGEYWECDSCFRGEYGKGGGTHPNIHPVA